MHRSPGRRLLDFHRVHGIAAPTPASPPAPQPRPLPSPRRPQPGLWVRALTILLALNLLGIAFFGLRLLRVEAELLAVSASAAEVQP